jgi:predicted acylesterase/phospholipase RssA
MPIDLSPLKQKRCALVLSGGVVKASAWHLGVALALEDSGFSFISIENPDLKDDIQISSYIGTSAGSLINLYFNSGYKPSHVIGVYLGEENQKFRPIRYKDILSLKRPLKKHAKNQQYDPFEEFPYGIKYLIKPLIKFSGLFSTDGLQRYLLDNVIKSNDFESYPDMFVVASQLDHSRKVIFSPYKYPNPRHDSTSSYYTGVKVTEAIAASMSVPPFYAPYPIKNPHTSQVDYYIDGEIRETLSTHVAVDNKCEYIFSSWTHTPYHYHDEIGSLVNYGIPAIAVQSIYLMIQKKIVTSRSNKMTAKETIDAVSQYMKDNKLSDEHRKNITSIMEERLDYKRGVKLIDIHPMHDDYKLFFSSSFSLNKETTSYLVNRGYKTTIETLRREFS